MSLIYYADLDSYNSVDSIRNHVIVGNVIDVLIKLYEKFGNFIDLVVTSPPYWALRDYKGDLVILGGDRNHVHTWGADIWGALRKWTPGDVPGPGSKVASKRPNLEVNRPASPSNFCECDAWRGNYGMEPHPSMYIDHSAQILDHVWDILKMTGAVFWNMGDSYSGSGGAGGDWNHGARAGEPKWGQPTIAKSYSGYTQKKGSGGMNSKKLATHGTENFQAFEPVELVMPVRSKSLVGIPEALVVELTWNHGWIRRNKLIWFKAACMPASVNDRYTIDFEPIEFFVKNNERQFWFNELTLGMSKTPPAGVDGVEGSDWDWETCHTCEGDKLIAKCPKCKKKTKIERYQGLDTRERGKLQCQTCYTIFSKAEMEKCPSCKGEGKYKESHWIGRDYYFEQQFEEYTDENLKRCTKPYMTTYGGTKKTDDTAASYTNATYRGKAMYDPNNSPGRNARTHWDMSTNKNHANNGVSHFATFPEELPSRAIDAACPRWICTKCGLPRFMVVKGYGGSIGKGDWINYKAEFTGVNERFEKGMSQFGALGAIKDGNGENFHREYAGYSKCGCNAPTVPGIVLDPFNGTGQTSIAAIKKGRDFIGIELNENYAKNSIKRIAKHMTTRL